MSNTVSTANTIESKADVLTDASKTFTYYKSMIDLAGEQEKDWQDDAQAAINIWRASRRSKNEFNILHSNVATLVPALYNSRPEPDVRPRHNKNRDDARVASQTLEHTLRYQMDEYEFDDILRAAVQDSQLQGRGQVRVRWKTYITKDQDLNEKVSWEETVCERIPWASWRRGPGAAWTEVPFVAYELRLSRDELRKLIPKPVNPEDKWIADEVDLDVVEVAINSTSDKDFSKAEMSVFKRARVWEVWDKDIRKIVFFAPGYTKSVLHIAEDPLGLLDFFDCPPPLTAIQDPETLTPICPYNVYREQADELNTVSERIRILTKALRVRGIRASEIPELDHIESLNDNEFLPSEGAMSLMGGAKGLADAIWVWPIDMVIKVIRELIAIRESIKQTIYEITGIADVLRGASDPNETLGAQQIKAQWGSLRINDQQRQVQKFCRNILRIKAEIISNKFHPATLQQIMDEPLNSAVIELLRSDVRRTMLIDVETDSTIRGDLVRAQENMNMFMSSTAQFIQTFVPMLQSGTLPPQLGQAAVTIYAAFARQFKLGKTVEDVLAKLEQAAQQAGLGEKTPEQQMEEESQKQFVQAAQQLELADKQASLQDKQTSAAQKATKMQLDAADAQTKAQIANVDIQKKAAEIQAQMVETALMAETGSAGPGFVQ